MATTPQLQPPTVVSTKRRGRRWGIAVVAVAILGGGWYALDRADQPRLIAGPMVQIPAAGSLAIVWKVESSHASHGSVLFGLHGDDRRAVRSPIGYDASTTNVTAGTRWLYEVSNTGFLGREIQLRRGLAEFAKEPGTPFRFLAFGDSGNGSNTQRAVAETMIAAKPDLIIHLGDLIYPNGAAEDFKRNFFDPYRELLARVPFMPSLGNHDVATNKGQPFLDVFVLPENGPKGIQPERNYWFDFGDARFVALD